jgi:hypothetical protein
VKPGFYPVLILIFFSLIFATTPANCQEESSSSKDAGLPLAPSQVRATTCTENNGKPCPDWVHKMVGQYPPLSESGELQLTRDASAVHFWTYRGWQDPPLRTNKQVFRSKLFLATHIGGAIAMIVACHTKNSGEDWASEVPAVAGIFGLDYLQFRFVGAPNAIGPPIYEMIHYGLASAR